jgi:hypothetical protein
MSGPPRPAPAGRECRGSCALFHCLSDYCVCQVYGAHILFIVRSSVSVRRAPDPPRRGGWQSARCSGGRACRGGVCRIRCAKAHVSLTRGRIAIRPYGGGGGACEQKYPSSSGRPKDASDGILQGSGRRRTMPTISLFYGTIIQMWYERDAKHSMPHFHTRYGGDEASFTLSGDILVGKFPQRQAALVKA